LKIQYLVKEVSTSSKPGEKKLGTLAAEETTPPSEKELGRKERKKEKAKQITFERGDDKKKGMGRKKEGIPFCC